MDTFKDTVSFWASILGTFLGLLGVLQSITWLAALGGVLILGSICVITKLEELLPHRWAQAPA